MRVADFLTEHHVTFEMLVHPPAFTAQKRAKFLHVSGRQVVKAVLLATPADFVLAVLPATHHIDTEALARSLGGAVRLAKASEVARVFADCEYGVVVPFGTLYGLRSVMDERLHPEATLIFEGHTHAEAIRMRCCDFEQLEKPVRLSFAVP